MSRVAGGYMVHERTDGRVSLDRGTAAPHPKWIVPLGLTACYLAFALGVHVRLLDSLDMAVRRAAGTGEVWGLLPVRAARVVHWLQPAHLAAPLLLLVAVLSLTRCSLRPFVVTAAVGVPVIAVTVGTKWVMAHTETDATPVPHGSFPSGHTVAVIVVVGLAVLLLRPGTRWAWVLPALLGCVIGSALILAWVHPATDVIGAVLLAAAALTGAQAAGLGEWARVRQTRSVR
jgi:membrane-associated phospholipid phosphatase